jgi:hypothetical protein
VPLRPREPSAVPFQDVLPPDSRTEFDDYRHRVPPASGENPPVRVQIGPDGKLIIASEDVEALNRMEEFLLSSIPPPKEFHVFHLKNAPAYWVKLNLQDFFKEDKDNSNDLLNSWWWGIPPQSDRGQGSQLGRRRPIRFIDDLDTNTIVVQGADRGELKIIQELIELYDVPEPVNAQNARVTRVFPVKYSKASVIAAALKDAFIDLLSSNDRALQNQQQNDRPTATVIRNYGIPGVGGEPEEKRTQITFKGKLAIGVDELTNSLIVSAEGESLINIVGEVIDELDQAARTHSHIAVLQQGAYVNGERLQEVLKAVLGEAQAGQPGQPQVPQQPPYPGYPPQGYPQPQVQPIIVE